MGVSLGLGVSLGILVDCSAAGLRFIDSAEISGPELWERPRMALADPRGVFSNRAGCLKRRH